MRVLVVDIKEYEIVIVLMSGVCGGFGGIIARLRFFPSVRLLSDVDPQHAWQAMCRLYNVIMLTALERFTQRVI